MLLVVDSFIRLFLSLFVLFFAFMQWVFFTFRNKNHDIMSDFVVFFLTFFAIYFVDDVVFKMQFFAMKFQQYLQE